MLFFIPTHRFELLSILKKNLNKQFLSLILILLTFTSCKTIMVPEKWVFKETKYNYEKIHKEIVNSNYIQSEKDSLISLHNTIIKTNEQLIFSTKKVTVTRKFLKLDTLNLEYFVFEPQKTEKIGLFFIGNASNIPQFGDNLSELSDQSNSKIYVLNYRGYGKSDGVPSFKTQFEDNTRFFNEIIKYENKVDYVIGYSLGSVFASKLATENSINNLILLSPFSNASEILKHQKKVLTKGPKAIFRPFIKLKTEEHLLSISNTNQIRNYKGKLTIFHGTDDQTLPYKMGINLFENASTSTKQLHTIKDGNHSSPFRNENWSKLILEVKS